MRDMMGLAVEGVKRMRKGTLPKFIFYLGVVLHKS